MNLNYPDTWEACSVKELKELAETGTYGQRRIAILLLRDLVHLLETVNEEDEQDERERTK